MNNKIRIVVDDIREAPMGWLLFKNPEEFIQWRRENANEVIQVLSLDHDMGLEFYDGYDLVKCMIEIDSMNAQLIERVQFHTDNMVGFTNMYHYFVSAKNHGLVPDMNIIKEKMSLIDGRMSFSGYTPIRSN